MKSLITIIFAVLIVNKGISCGNEYGYSLEGKKIYTRYFYLSDNMLHFNESDLNEKLNEHEVYVKNGTADHEKWSNIALYLMKLGKADSSVQILKRLALKYPTEYTIIANLGTAYELTNQLDSALKYISKGYEVYPRSHFKSEWIHIKILEAKIQAKKNISWYDKNDILPLHELKGYIERGERSMLDLNNQLFYQIRTRAPFTPAPNKVITNLLLTLGDLNKEYGTYENAFLAYAYAIQFEDRNYHQEKIMKRIGSLNVERQKQDHSATLPNEFMWLLKRSKLNHNLLLEGLPEFANKMHSLDSVLYEKKDSISILTTQLDSLQQQNNQIINNYGTKSKKALWSLAGIGIIILILVVIVIYIRIHK